ncbi:hypothetical protein CMMCAS04_14515 [Clavibacter michiganensis subsp. michiganensis]|nr:hypothetical protein CMMCAS04_14515 [Clavibacter michiganensis subsp. michiganensis]
MISTASATTDVMTHVVAGWRLGRVSVITEAGPTGATGAAMAPCRVGTGIVTVAAAARALFSRAAAWRSAAFACMAASRCATFATRCCSASAARTAFACAASAARIALSCAASAAWAFRTASDCCDAATAAVAAALGANADAAAGCTIGATCDVHVDPSQ